ncbi:Uncharacterised protein [Streptococcus pneumoniae]|nr:Uncharacterised protein [Streptococcus pneumoniae]
MYTSKCKEETPQDLYQEDSTCHKKNTSWPLTRELQVLVPSFSTKKGKRLARVKKSLPRFFLRQVGLSTMPMKFGTLFSQLLRVLSSKVVSSQIKSRQSGLPTNVKQRLSGIRKQDFLSTMLSFGSHARQHLWLSN